MPAACGASVEKATVASGTNARPASQPWTITGRINHQVSTCRSYQGVATMPKASRKERAGKDQRPRAPARLLVRPAVNIALIDAGRHDHRRDREALAGLFGRHL